MTSPQFLGCVSHAQEDFIYIYIFLGRFWLSSEARLPSNRRWSVDRFIPLCLYPSCVSRGSSTLLYGWTRRRAENRPGFTQRGVCARCKHCHHTMPTLMETQQLTLEHQWHLQDMEIFPEECIRIQIAQRMLPNTPPAKKQILKAKKQDLPAMGLDAAALGPTPKSSTKVYESSD